MNFQKSEINFHSMGPRSSIWHQTVGELSYKDSFEVWIVLKGHDLDRSHFEELRYFKHIRISGQDRDTSDTMLRLFDEMKKCWETGPDGMTLVEDGGYLPMSV